MPQVNQINLADIYGSLDQAKANQAQMQANQMRQQQMQYEIGRQREQDMRQDQVRGAYKDSIENINGVPTLNEKRAISRIYEVDPIEAMQAQEKFAKRDADAAKTKSETSKAALENKKATAAYLRDKLATVKDQQGYEAFLQESQELGATGILQSAPAQFDPEFQRSQLYTADEFLKQTKPDYQKVDLGGKIQVIDMNPVTNPKIKGTQFDKTLTPEAILTDQRTRAEGAANRGVTIRGQNLTDARGARANEIAADKASNPPKTALSAAAQKELFEADEMVQASKNAIGMLQEAKKLNKTAYSGVGAKPRAIIASNLGMGSGGADDTVNLDNLMTGQALESLKATFGGMPTEGERKILLDIQASADKTPSQRAAILDRAEKAAERRIKFNESKAKALRSGTYFNEQQQTQQDVPPVNDVRSAADKILGL